MDLTEAVEHRLEVREFSGEAVADDVERAVAEAARLSPSSQNRQDWHFLLVDGDALSDLAAMSATGGWVANAAFAVVVLTEDYVGHDIDVGRSVTHMQFAAWDHGVGSCLYTGVEREAFEERFGVSDDLVVGAVVGFGDPAGSGSGRKQRRPFDEVVSHNRFGDPLSE